MYAVYHNDRLLDVFTTEELARASLKLTYSQLTLKAEKYNEWQCEEPPPVGGILTIKPWSPANQVTHL